MKYRFVLLKDLPEFKVGSIFPLYRVIKSLNKKSYYEIGKPKNNHGKLNNEVGGILDNPEWFRKEIDEDRVTDLKCPKCAETRVFLYHDELYNLNKEREGFCPSGCIESALAFQCVSCGHKRILYGSKNAIQKIEKQIEDDDE